MKTKDVFNGGVAVITGAGSGIGEALAMQAAACGMTVVIAEMSAERGERVAAAINESGGKALFVQTNVTERESVKNLADTVFNTYGSVRLLINNAGISVMGKIWEVSEDDWDRSLDVNLRGMIYCVRAFVPRMLASDEPGYVCNIASLASFSMSDRMAPYFNTKHAVLSFSECLNIEMQGEPKPLHVTVAAPGLINTRIFKDTTIATDQTKGLVDMMQGALDHIGMSAEEAAKIIIDGIAAERFLVSTHPSYTESLAVERGNYLIDIHNRKPQPSNTDFMAPG